ncbi:DUF5316 family protein [Desulforamulus aquiferis]|uniref:DUF5316 family protein n=1 Tax=Desulforamulus aquiferis TaxID=1397668 RepID=A0AAW7ZH90_9FIRM|nr:DUF5316 family protein [Desulforamulus aquiferis]MDO7788791.1 DUF5316 family protein [Desulforamulus aquiferis]
MRKPLSIKASLMVGILILLTIVVLIGDNSTAAGYSFFMGLALWAISALIGGAIGNLGDRIRTINYSPDREQVERSRWASMFFYIGLPGVVVGFVFLYMGWF